MYVCVYIVSICKYTENVNKCLLACAIDYLSIFYGWYLGDISI